MVTDKQIEDAVLTIFEFLLDDELLWSKIPESLKDTIRLKAKDYIRQAIPEEQIMIAKSLLLMLILLGDSDVCS